MGSSSAAHRQKELGQDRAKPADAPDRECSQREDPGPDQQQHIVAPYQTQAPKEAQGALQHQTQVHMTIGEEQHQQERSEQRGVLPVLQQTAEDHQDREAEEQAERSGA